MLGNQYFMARNYIGAASAFQDVLKEDPANTNARKKLIISLTQIGKYTQAIDQFSNFIGDNIDSIINTDPVKDDCPCPELVHNLENLTFCYKITQKLGCSKNDFEKALEQSK